MSNVVSQLLLEKLREQVERTEHLISLIPSDQTGWCPNRSSMTDRGFLTVNELVFHLSECLAGFCAALYGAYKDQLAHFPALRKVRRQDSFEIEEARRLLRIYMSHIEEGFVLLTDEDLKRQIPTVFVPAGEAIFTILAGNLEHFMNHKFQLFFYLKMLGVPVKTSDLYRLR